MLYSSHNHKRGSRMEESNKLSVSALIGLVIGVVALLLSAVPIINNFAAVLGVIGLIMGVVGLMKIRKNKRSGMKIAISAIVISLLSIVVVLASQAMYGAALDEVSETFEEETSKMTGESTEELLESDVTVVIGDFAVQTDEYGYSQTSLPVTITNKNSEKKSYSIHIEAVDTDSNRVLDDYVYANDLSSGQTQEFKVFQYVESEKLESMKNAGFKIVEVSQY